MEERGGEDNEEEAYGENLVGDGFAVSWGIEAGQAEQEEVEASRSIRRTVR